MNNFSLKTIQNKYKQSIFHTFFYRKQAKKLQNTIDKLGKQFYLTFDSDSYIKANNDVALEIKKGRFINGLEHFMLFGYDEVLNGKRCIGEHFPYYDKKNYLHYNEDLKNAKKQDINFSPYKHFLEYGYQEFLNGQRLAIGYYPFSWDETLQTAFKNIFDEEAYIDVNPDIQTSISTHEFKNGWEHFKIYGVHEVCKGERQIHSQISKFNEIEYLIWNKDIHEMCLNTPNPSPFRHFLLYGYKEILEGARVAPFNSNYIYKLPKLTDTIKQEIKNFKHKPLLSIIMPVYNVNPKWLNLAIDSIKNQWYEKWELCIADDASTNQDTLQYLKSINHPKIKIKFMEKNLNISAASNEALKLASGEYIALMDNDDELTSDALYEVVKAINEDGAEFIYSDEDKLEMDGSYSEPHFKPDFAPDMFLSQNYLSHLGVIKKEFIDKVGGWEIGLEGAQDYDLYLKVLELTDKIVHIPKVLYHWRKIPGSTAAEFSDKSYAQEAGRKALEHALKRRGIDAIVKNGLAPGTYKVEYTLKSTPLVSIIIPFKDKPELLKMSIESVLNKSTYTNFEIIGMSNNSEEQATFDEMKRLESLDTRVKFYEYNKPFNYSAINNYAVEHFAKGEHLVLMNNDIEIITPEWIEELLMHSQRKEIGVVGAKLYYPNDTIQHAGVIIGIGGIAGHSHKYFNKDIGGYFSRLKIIQNLSANTAALFMVKKAVYEEVGGLNEKDLTVAFNDVDFCLRVQEKGYLNLFTPYCEAYHHESISRGAEDNPEKIARFNSEVEYMKKRHSELLVKGDPYYNPNLTLDREDFGLRG